MTAINERQIFIKGHLKNALFSLENQKNSYQGKVRELYEKKDTLVMVTTDRVSAFDQVLGSIPLKGALLCEQAHFWLNSTKDICDNHLLDRPDPQIFVIKKAQPIKIEMIIRGFLAGSLMRQTPQTRGQEYGLSLSPHLKNYQEFSAPIITPTTKADEGEHDMPVSLKQIVQMNLINQKGLDELCDKALALFSFGSKLAKERGLYLVDTKYEFGYLDGKIILIDEIHTTDSSRYFSIDDYQQKMNLNQAPQMLDKEFLRQYLLNEFGEKAKEKLENFSLSDEIRIELADKYFALTEMLLKQDFIPPQEGAKTRVPRILEALLN